MPTKAHKTTHNLTCQTRNQAPPDCPIGESDPAGGKHTLFKYSPYFGLLNKICGGDVPTYFR